MEQLTGSSGARVTGWVSGSMPYVPLTNLGCAPYVDARPALSHLPALKDACPT